MPRGVYPHRKRGVTQRVIRTLQPGEPIPDGIPRRFRGRGGYVLLRWKVGVQRYVEVREHRLIADGLGSEHVHHVNHDPADNRAENLIRLTAKEHGALHGTENRLWDRDEAADLYAAGWSTTDLAAKYGVHHVSILRGLRAAGVALRTPGEARRTPVDTARVLSLYRAGLTIAAAARLAGVTEMVARRVLQTNGLQSRRTGAPTLEQRALEERLRAS